MTTKNILLATLMAAGPLMANAQYLGEGYYRISNLGLKGLDKEETYLNVDFNKVNVSTSSGTAQNFEAAVSWPTEKRDFHTSPASVIYIKVNGSNIGLAAQGTTIADMTSYQISLTQNGSANSYQLSSTASGVTLYLWAKKSASSLGRHICTTDNQSSSAYKFWAMYKIGTDDATYLGVKPTLEAEGKYYAPYYVSFPFKTVSDGMKVYYVDSATSETFSMQEISGVVPGGVPVIIECSSADPSANRIEPVAGSYGTISGNCLSGTYFCDDFEDPTAYPTARVTFDANTMRTWSVEDGKLVLSTDNSLLHSSYYSGELKNGYINANESYLNVPSTYGKSLKRVASGIDEVQSGAGEAKVVSYTTLGGMRIKEPQPGTGVVIVKYSNGNSKTVVY